MADDYDEAERRIAAAKAGGADELNLRSLDIERLPDSLGTLSHLKTLDLRGCQKLTDIRAVARLTELKALRCGWVTEPVNWEGQSFALSDIRPLSGLTGLQRLDLMRCDQLTDVSVLSTLTGLQQLDLSGCSQLTDVSVLSALMGLQQLNLSGCSQLTDVSVLSTLTGLQQLDLRGCDQLTDVSVLSTLTGLQQLNLRVFSVSVLSTLTGLQQLSLNGCLHLTDVSVLNTLTGLQQLNLSMCDQLTDVSVLSNLTGLQQLDLSSCHQLTDVSVLNTLTGLQQLNLRYCSQLTDMSGLSTLTGLQQLDLSGCSQLTDVSVLSTLTGLQQLDLSGCSQLTDVSVLSALTGLQQLDLSGCSQLTDVSVLSALTGLQQLNLYDSMALPVTPRDLPLTWWPELEVLYANRLISAPSELGSANLYFDNCLPRIRAWHRDLATGIAPNADLKLFVLGNGRVGKTQICRRLKGEGFDTSIPSTHGISLGQTRLIEVDTEADPPEPAVDLRFWDFGGQDVYLGTHALFLDDRAVYVIAWTPSHENTDEFEENGVPMRNRPLRYWLEYVRSLAGPQAPVIVVQTQCDRERDVSSAPPIPADHGFERLRIADCSARSRNGMARLMLELESAAWYQLERYGEVQLPANWVAVGDDLRRMRDEEGIRTQPHDEFERLCAEQHQTAVPDVVLEYLHRSGQVFWKRGVFGDQVVLDQAWALDGMYAVLHRDSALPLIRERYGRFSPLLLEKLVWQNRTEEERKLFLSMMETCQTCFKIAEGTYVAPALLSLESAVAGQIADIWRGAEAQVEVKLHYAFLHEGVLRALLCGIGSRAGVQAVYWRYGVCFYDQMAAGVVRIRSELPDPSGQGGGWISVETTGANAAALAREVVGSIERINIGAKPEVVWRDETPAGLSSREIEPAEPFAALQPGPKPLALDEPRPVYVSYAWGGESERLVDDLEGRLADRGYVLRRDKRELRPGHWISEFEREIARADRVIVVLSPKYLESIYCMQELIHLYAQVLGDRVRFHDKVIAVVLDGLDVADPCARLDCTLHWQGKYKTLEDKRTQVNGAHIGGSTQLQLWAYDDIQKKADTILGWIADVLMPRGAAGIDAALTLLEGRTRN